MKGTFTLPPAFKAKNEIERLLQKPELRRICRLGGSLTPEEVAENILRHSEFIRQRAEIIKKYNVVAEYLEPLLAKEQELLAELEEVQADIALLK